MALIFAGTLAQVHLGIHEAQQRYFQSFFVWWPPEGRGIKFPIFPGGHLIGAVLLINLIAAHAKRFRWAWRKLGIHLTHAGLIIMLAGGLFTDLFAVESHTPAAKRKNIRRHHPRRAGRRRNDQSSSIKSAPFRNQYYDTNDHQHPSLPFRIVVGISSRTRGCRWQANRLITRGRLRIAVGAAQSRATDATCNRPG